MELNQLSQIDIADAVPICHAERTINVVSNLLKATTSPSQLARVDQGDPPWLRVPLMDLHLVRGHVQGDVRHVQKVVGEVLLDDLAAIPAADDKVIDSVRAKALHDVPEDGTPADLNHRLGA